jgi:hypothetical protein
MEIPRFISKTMIRRNDRAFSSNSFSGTGHNVFNVSVEIATSLLAKILAASPTAEAVTP